MERPAYRLSVKEVLQALGSSPEGLTSDEVKRRVTAFGVNDLPEDGRNLAELLFRNLGSFFVLLLLLAGFLSYWFGSVAEAIVLWFVAGVNFLVGFFQEARAEQAMRLLRVQARGLATVFRDGELLSLPNTELVPGDALKLEAGGQVPADARLIEETHLFVDESLMTGESRSIKKDVVGFDKTLPIRARSNMVFAGTSVTHGRGLAVVVAIAESTELGRIAKALGEQDRPTPLQSKVRTLCSVLLIVVALFVSLLFFLGALQGLSLRELWLPLIALLVAAVPESLPTVVTVGLSRAAHSLARKQAIVRNLSALEALGEVTTLISDKTGTLTRNEQTVEELRLFTGRSLVRVTVTGRGYRPEGRVVAFGRGRERLRVLRRLLEASVLCNDAVLSTAGHSFEPIGDRLEGALLVAALKYGLLPEAIRKVHPRLFEIPFDPEQKMMLTVHPDRIVMKGAPEVVVRAARLRSGLMKEVLSEVTKLAGQGYRVLAIGELSFPARSRVAKRMLDAVIESRRVTDVKLLGLIATIDPLRSSAAATIERARALGLKVVIATGDLRETTLQLIERLHIRLLPHEVVSGEVLEGLAESELKRRAPSIRVCFRATPDVKRRLVRSLEQQGEVVAATGDGLNDVLLLKEATVGVGLGYGSDVARESSDLILADNDLGTFIPAVEMGRSLVGNVRQVIIFLLSGNLAELVLLGTFPLVGAAFPLTAAQILWVNLVTDLLPALALITPHGQPQPLPDRLRLTDLRVRILGLGLFVAGIAGLVYAALLPLGLVYARSLTFAVLSALQMGIFLSLTSGEGGSLISRLMSLLGQKVQLFALFASTLLMLIPFLSFFQPIFGTTTLGSTDLVLLLGISVIGFFLSELFKLRRRPILSRGLPIVNRAPLSA